MRKKTAAFFFVIASLCTLLLACNREDSSQLSGLDSGQRSLKLKVYKSPTCGCCADWVEHIEQRGFVAQLHHPADLSAFKRERGIAAAYQSCHTAISEQGYIFEGHIPAKVMQRFLQERPVALGLSVPAMPLGSPGMEIDDKFRPYQVLLLKMDGSVEVYAEFKTQQDQY